MVARAEARHIHGPEPPILSEEHRRELEEGSGISPEVIAARGYYTARRPDELPDAFPRWQRRPGLVVPGLSPSETPHYQYKPRKPIRRKSGPGPKYETPHGAEIMLDVNPLMLEEVRHGAGELWITEGAKKVDALASWGVSAVGLTGVYMAAAPGSKGTEPLPCWRHVRLKGRTMIIAFDADAKTNADVQEALRRLVAMLEALGAVVLVVYVPAVGDDTKAGVDDYKAAGLTLDGLRRRAQPFVPLDVGRERIRRNGKLRRAIAERRRYLRGMPVKTIGENTRAAVVRVLTEEAPKTGELVEGGVRVVMDRRTLAEKAAKSRRAVNKAVEALEDEPGALRVDNANRRAEKAGAFVLPIAQKGTQEGSKGAPEGKAGQEGESFSRLSNAPADRGGYPSALSDEVPALRWSKTIFYWEWKGSTRELADYFHVSRLGEKRGQIIRHVLEDGGNSSVEDLMERFAGERTRPWDFRRRTLGPLVNAGILVYTDEGVRLTAGWREALEREREDKDELEDACKQRERHAEQRRKYRQRDKTQADEERPLKGKKRVEKTLERHRPRWAQERVEDQRQKVGMTATVYLSDELAGVSGMRFQDLRQRWIERDGQTEDLTRAVRDPLSPFRFERDQVDDHLYVYPAGSPKQSHARRDPAPVAPLRTERRAEHKSAEPRHIRHPKKEPRKVNGVHVHGPACECWLCEDEPSYAGGVS